MVPGLRAEQTATIIQSGTAFEVLHAAPGVQSQPPATLADKTLVAWTSPANLEQQGGGVLSLMNGERFDALVLGEKQRGTWMAGSDFFKRTQADQTTCPLEQSQPGQFVQMAVVYAGNHITLYRNGRRYSDYDAGSQEVFGSDTDILIYHEGTYYMYYLAGPGGRWDAHELATSTDGVHWKEHGVMVKPREGVSWIGTGHIWESPDFDTSRKWVMNYSEWFGDKQDILFVTSTDLLNWTKVDEKFRFVQDVRWYKEKGRWDCIDTLRRPDGSLYGYFTADPDPAKVSYRPCGFGFAESKDGITWTALPPVEGDMNGEFGGIQKIGDKYYILISQGLVATGDKPEGPFHAQQKNPNAFGEGSDIYFPRFFHNAPGGPLVNHFYQNGTVHAAPLKAIEVDRQGILRLKWWNNNDKLKATPLDASLADPGAGYAASLRMLGTMFDKRHTYVIEGTLTEPAGPVPTGRSHGIFLDRGNGQGQYLLMACDGVRFAEVKSDGSELKVLSTSSRGMDLGTPLKFRLLIKDDMLELYVNDYLMNTKRVQYNGQIGLMGADDTRAFQDIKVWQSH
ncbi:MAG: hypothetical protein NTW21_28110 [Verrucomicrobia bacterium]|nr:hypothetical protein [Verrucomicrobiota bacterium]